MLHEMAAGVVGDHGMRNAFGLQFESGQARALIARPGFIHPDVKIDARAHGLVDRRKRRAPVDGREPAGVAMREDVEPAAGVSRGKTLDDLGAMIADCGAGRDDLLGDRRGFRVSRDAPLRDRRREHNGARTVERPAQVRGAVGRVASSAAYALLTPASEESSAMASANP